MRRASRPWRRRSANHSAMDIANEELDAVALGPIRPQASLSRKRAAPPNTGRQSG